MQASRVEILRELNLNTFLRTKQRGKSESGRATPMRSLRYSNHFRCSKRIRVVFQYFFEPEPKKKKTRAAKKKGTKKKKESKNKLGQDEAVLFFFRGVYILRHTLI